MDVKTLAVALMALPGFGRHRFIELLRQSGSDWPQLDYAHDVLDWIGDHSHELRLKSLPWKTEHVEDALKEAEAILELCCDLNLAMAVFAQKDYPKRLARISKPPAILYTQGSQASLAAPLSVAVVGTREPTKWGRRAALGIGRTLGESDIVVVSGLAIGCDTFAHEGCLAGNGETVAVLAHGLDRVYPAKNRMLAKKIVESGGCLVSEYPPGVPPFRNQFVDRDRLQIGLSDFLILIESDVQGGSMHTVRFSEEQAKPIGALAHPDHYLSEPKTKGNQALIRSKQAYPIKDVESLANLISRVSGPSPKPGEFLRHRQSDNELISDDLKDPSSREIE